MSHLHSAVSRYHISSSLAFLQTLNHDFDCARRGTVLARLEGLSGILQAVPMCGKTLDIDDAAFDQTNGTRPHVGVAVLKLEVDLG